MAQPQSEEKSDKINFVIVQDALKAALLGEDDVDMEKLLDGLDELFKLFPALGIIFSLISKDLIEDLAFLRSVLYEYLVGHLYKTVKIMVKHEKKYNLLYRKDSMSGCWILLKIQEGLDFICKFLKKINDNHETSVACREAYDLTLLRDHSFVKRSAATLGIYMLPTRENFLKRICKDEDHVQQTLDVLPEALATCATVYTKIDNLYTVNNIHTFYNNLRQQ